MNIDRLSDVQLTSLTILLTIRDGLRADRQAACCRHALDASQSEHIASLDVQQMKALVAEVRLEFRLAVIESVDGGDGRVHADRRHVPPHHRVRKGRFGGAHAPDDGERELAARLPLQNEPFDLGGQGRHRAMAPQKGRHAGREAPQRSLVVALVVRHATSWHASGRSNRHTQRPANPDGFGWRLRWKPAQPFQRDRLHPILQPSLQHH